MKNIIIAAVLFVPLLVLTFLGKGGSSKGLTETTELPAKPWITVAKTEVSVLSADGQVISKLNSGDSLDMPVTLAVGSGGEATIHFLDGSVLRLDSGTRVSLNDGSYDKKDGTLMVKASLAVGRVWSKVIELATPASVWEVRTSNAVATVRGTAFGVSSDGNHSKVFGSQHEVSVKAVDPKTGQDIGGEPVVVGEGKLVELNNDDVEKIKLNKKKFAAADIKDISAAASATISPEQGWFRANEAEDREVESDVKDLKSSGIEGEELHRELVKRSRRAMEAELKIRDKKEGMNKVDIKPEDQKDVDQDEKPAPLPIKKVEIKPAVRDGVINQVEVKTDIPVAGTVVPSRGVPVELLIEPGLSLATALVEQQKVLFKAILLFSDGHKEDITSSVEWRVVGPIGAIDKSGIFLGKLADEVSENGEASGSVTAVWRGNDKELSAKTPLFKVLFKVEDDSETRG